MANQHERRRAVRLLEGLYQGLMERVTDQVIEREAHLAPGSVDYVWEEVEDRFAMRVMHLGHLIGSLQGSLERPTRRETRVEVLRASPETLETRVNERIAKHQRWQVARVELQTLEHGELLAMLTLVRDVPLERRDRQGEAGGARA